MTRWVVAAFLVGTLGCAGAFETLPAHDWTLEAGGRTWGVSGYDGYRFGGHWREEPTTVVYLGPVQWQWGVRFEVAIGVSIAALGVAVSGVWLWWRRRVSAPRGG